MISNVSFSGRETMLTNRLEKAAEVEVIKASTYLSEKLAPVVRKEQVVAPVYTSPFMPTGNPVAQTEKVGKILNFFG